MIPLRIEDDDGRRVRLSLRSHFSGEGVEGGRGLWRGLRPMVRLVWRGGTSRAGLVLTASIAALVVVGSSFLAIGPVMLPVLLFSPVLSTLVLLGLTSAVRFGDALSAWTEGFKSDCLEHGRCPACAYGVGGVEADGRGFVVCPECGARWVPLERRRGSSEDVVVVVRR